MESFSFQSEPVTEEFSHVAELFHTCTFFFSRSCITMFILLFFVFNDLSLHLFMLSFSAAPVWVVWAEHPFELHFLEVIPAAASQRVYLRPPQKNASQFHGSDFHFAPAVTPALGCKL